MDALMVCLSMFSAVKLPLQVLRQEGPHMSLARLDLPKPRLIMMGYETVQIAKASVQPNEVMLSSKDSNC